MKWTMIRLPSGEALLSMVVSPREGDEICQDLLTGDDSPDASKSAFRAFMKASHPREMNASE